MTDLDFIEIHRQYEKLMEQKNSNHIVINKQDQIHLNINKKNTDGLESNLMNLILREQLH